MERQSKIREIKRRVEKVRGFNVRESIPSKLRLASNVSILLSKVKRYYDDALHSLYLPRQTFSSFFELAPSLHPLHHPNIRVRRETW